MKLSDLEKHEILFHIYLEWPWKVRVKVIQIVMTYINKSHKGALLGPVLMLSISRKPYVGRPMAPSDLTLSGLERLCGLERLKSRARRFWGLISRSRVQLGHMLLLNVKTIFAESNGTIWAWVTMKGQIQGHSNFKVLYLVKDPSSAQCYC